MTVIGSDSNLFHGIYYKKSRKMKGVQYTPYERHSLKKAVCEGRIESVRKIISSRSLYYSQEWSDASDGYALLCTAIEMEHTEIAKLLLTNGSRVNSENKNPSDTPLYFAIRNGDIEIVQILLDKDADINALTISGDTPLQFALTLNMLARVEPTSRGSQIPMYIATNIGREKIINLLLSKGANVNVKNANGETALHWATKTGNSRIVEQLLSHGAYVNACDNQNGYIPLHFAAENSNEEITKLLLSKSANVNAKAKYGATPLHLATGMGQLKIVEHLLKYRADVNTMYTSGPDESYTPLHLATRNGNKEMIKLLLNRGANVNAEIKDGRTSVHIALFDGDEQIAKHLLEYGANVNTVYRTSGRMEGYTPLHLAARNVSEEIIKLILSKGANINAEAKDGATPLHLATGIGRFKIVEHLLKYGANVNAVCSSEKKKGYTPLHLAAENGHLDVIQLFLKFGARINSTDEYGITALHIASRNGCKKIVTALLEHGSDATIMSKKNYTALDLAMYPHKAFGDDYMYSNYGHVYIAKILKHHMVKIKAANLYAVNKDILSILSPIFGSQAEELSDFRNECEKEVASMKSEVINDNITLYDILTGSVHLLAKYARNESIVEVIRSDNYKIKYPIYASMIKRNFRKGEREKKFIEKGDQIFGFLFSKNLPWLPRDCIEKILSYLNYEDLI